MADVTQRLSAERIDEWIEKQSGLMWGGSKYPFTSLQAFLAGLRIGFELSQSCDSWPDFVPKDFHRFVTEYFGRTYPDGGKGWQTLISENTASEQEAYEEFLSLRRLARERKL
jgi:hypothetical protein